MAEQHGMFISVEVDPAAAGNKEIARKLVEVCPVNIFEIDSSGNSAIVDENLDECVLCELCVEAAPAGQIKVHRLYSGETLER